MPDKIIYKIGGLPRPTNNLKSRILLLLNQIPFIRKLFQNTIRKNFNLPQSTALKSGFYLSSKNIKVGNNVGLEDTFILAYAKVTIGNNCSFSFRNMIITSTHDVADFSTIIAKPVTIGNNVWITTNVTILPGVTIGDNSIIGAGSVVTKNIPSGVFATGNPCEVKKEISFVK
ncbi:MAG: maltose O-acetyltransferase [Cellulophaga sp.]|nr:maltose O-acetyltransferase [Cellulophaga sp.]